MPLHEEEFDKMYKEELFENINVFSEKIDQFTKLIYQASEYTNIKVDLPNIALNLNNKLVLDIFPKFKKANIQFGSTNSVFGEAIMFDLIDRTTNGVRALEKYSNNLSVKNQTSLVPASNIRSLFSRLRILFTGDILTKEQQKNAKLNLKEYKTAAKSIANYSLEKDFQTSLFSYFEDNSFPREIMLEILEDDINPNLKKLNLESLIPGLKNEALTKSTIIKSQKKNNFFKGLKASSKIALKGNTFNDSQEIVHDDLYK